MSKCALVLAAGLLAATTTNTRAADLGGNCCADLEERIAELEATTARKGNRKVSLEINGWVNQALFVWDDGVDSGAYVGTNSLEQERVNFIGKAKINQDWTAGYRLEIGLASAPSSGHSQLTDDPGDTISIRYSHWFLQSKTFGKFAVGRNGTATYHLLDDATLTNTRYYSDAEAATVAFNGFRLRDRATGAFLPGNITWGGITPGTNNDTFGQNGRRDVIRYDSPEFAGFTFTATWGEDDMAGAALTYKNKFGDFGVLGKVGYESLTDETPRSESCNAITAVGVDCHWWGAAGSILHEPTGLFVYGGYGEQQDDSEEDAIPGAEGTDSFWFIQAGIEKKFFALGKSTLFAEYREDERGANSGISGDVNALSDNDILGANLEFFAVGAIQTLDNAAMDLYAIYRHGEGDLDQVNGHRELEDFDLVMTGARIKF